MTFGSAFAPELVGSFGLVFGLSIGSSIWTIRCPTSSTADQPALGLPRLAAGLDRTTRRYAEVGGRAFPILWNPDARRGEGRRAAAGRYGGDEPVQLAGGGHRRFGGTQSP